MSGKMYSGERGVIGITSWPPRINTVGLTLFSLYRCCPNFHIVLTLSEEEFPHKEADLPSSLLAMIKANMFEVLFVRKNYKSFKKWIFAAKKYPGLPVISADDDCMYKCNYAQELYDKWLEDISINGIRYEYGKLPQMQGPSSLYYLPRVYVERIIDKLQDDVIAASEDDKMMYKWMNSLKCRFSFVHRNTNKPYIFHDIIQPLNPTEHYKSMKSFKSCFLDADAKESL